MSREMSKGDGEKEARTVSGRSVGRSYIPYNIDSASKSVGSLPLAQLTSEMLSIVGRA